MKPSSITPTLRDPQTKQDALVCHHAAVLEQLDLACRQLAIYQGPADTGTATIIRESRALIDAGKRLTR